FNQISVMLSGPIHGLAYGYEQIPLLFAFFLGLVGAVAPCQLTSNVSAITIYGKKSLVDRVPWLHVFLFILGKIVAFSVLGIIVWSLGKEVNSALTQFFPVVRKTIGPILIVIGLFMIRLFKFNQVIGNLKIPVERLKDRYLGSFLMGISFTLAFCPTMFILYIFTL